MEKEPIEILSAKSKGGLFCHYEYQESIGKDRHDTLINKSERPMHEDLREALLAFTPHLPVMLEDVKPGELPDINSDLNNFTGKEETLEMIKRFTFSEIEFDLDNNKIKLFGTKKLNLGTVPVQTPFVPLAGGNYHYAMELRLAVDKLIEEIRLYAEGKQAEEPEQLNLFGGPAEGNDSDDNEGGEDGEEKQPKRGRGRPKKVKENQALNVPAGTDKSELSDLERANLGNEDTEPITNFQRDPSEVEL